MRQLKNSFRSRKQLIDFSNNIFSTAFASTMSQDQVVLKPADISKTNRAANEAERLDVAINYRDLDAGNSHQLKYEIIAHQINDLIASKKQVFDKDAQQYRAVRYGDIAILCRSNSTCNGMGSTLSREGVPVGVSGFGLLSEPEIILSLALMKLLIFPQDSLAKAEVLLYSIFDGDQSAMINDRLNAEDNYSWQSDNEYIKGIQQIKKSAFDFSPSKALETIVAELNLEELFVTWGNLNQRISNMDALIFHAKEYQATCNRLQMASSISGFLNWMDKLHETEADNMGVQSGNVVQIITYHLSKGLEWPIVLLWDLDFNMRDGFFGVNVVETAPINLETPLTCLLYTSPSPRDQRGSRMPSSA